MRNVKRSIVLVGVWLASAVGGLHAEESDPAAIAFGEKIQAYVRNQDLQGIHACIRGELHEGPRRSWAVGKGFSAVFPESWCNEVLSTPPDKVGWRGYMLGNGLLWYDGTTDAFSIFSIQGVEEEKIDFTAFSPIWSVDGLLLRPSAFSYKWLSGDNYEAYATHFDIWDHYEKFCAEPGQFWGKEIPTLQPIIPSWSEGNETLSLITTREQWGKTSYPIEVKNRFVRCKKRLESLEEEVAERYRLIAPISSAQCKQLSPYLEGRWAEGFLVELHIPSGGSMGTQKEYTIFGLHQPEKGTKCMVPLRNFSCLNAALNWLDEQNDYVSSYDFSTARLCDLPWEVGAVMAGPMSAFVYDDYVGEHFPEWNYVQHQLGRDLFDRLPYVPADCTNQVDTVDDNPSMLIPSFESISDTCRLVDGELWYEIVNENGVVTLSGYRQYKMGIKVLEYNDYNQDGYMDVKLFRRGPGSACPWEEIVLSRKMPRGPFYTVEKLAGGCRENASIGRSWRKGANESVVRSRHLYVYAGMRVSDLAKASGEPIAVICTASGLGPDDIFPEETWPEIPTSP